jgi:hypothetical protein
VIDVTLATQADLVKVAVIHILIEGGYALDRKDHENLTTGHRGKSAAHRTVCSDGVLVQDEVVWKRW